MGVTFRANIRWPGNNLLFPADWFGVRPPPGLDLSYIRAPKYLQMLEMQKRLRSSAVRSGSSGTLATVDGLVDTDLTVRYADVAAQWRDGNRDAASIDGGHRSFGILLPIPKSSAKSTRRAGAPCAEPIGRQDAPLRQGRRLRGVPAGYDRAHQRHSIRILSSLRLVQPLALRRLAGRRRPGDGL